MPAYIQFGGTNGVPELDIGLPGGSLATGSTMNLTDQAPEVVTSESAVPQVNLVAVQRQGIHGQVFYAEGILKGDNHSVLNAIEDGIDEALGDSVASRPTRLKDNVKSRTWEKVVLLDWQRVGGRFVSVGGAVVQRYRMRFKRLQ